MEHPNSSPKLQDTPSSDSKGSRRGARIKNRFFTTKECNKCNMSMKPHVPNKSYRLTTMK